MNTESTTIICATLCFCTALVVLGCCVCAALKYGSIEVVREGDDQDPPATT